MFPVAPPRPLHVPLGTAILDFSRYCEIQDGSQMSWEEEAAGVQLSLGTIGLTLFSFHTEIVCYIQMPFPPTIYYYLYLTPTLQ